MSERARGFNLTLRPAYVLGFFLSLSLALNFAYLSGGFQADDLLFLNMLRADPLPFSRWRGAWSVAIDQFPGFTNLWWFEPGVEGRFFRPLPSLVLEGSLRLFGERAFPLHLLSVVLHGLVGFTTCALFARLSGRRVVGLLAGVIFVGCEDHSMSIGWIATMTDLLAVVFTNVALLVHLEWRTSGRRWWAAVETLCLAVALGCKESAVMAPAAVLLLEWFLTWRDQERLAEGVARWVPSVAVLGAYLALYVGLGLGGMRNLMYVDPIGQPIAYLQHAVTTFPVMITAALTVVSPSIAAFVPEWALPLAAAGVVLAVLVAWGLWPLRREATVLWALALFVLALLPQVATDASERLLYFPLVPFSYVLARLVVSIGPLARRLAPDAPALPRRTRAWGWYVLGGVALPGLVMSAVMPFYYVPSLQSPERHLLSGLTAMRTHLEAHPSGAVVLVNTSGPFLTFYAGGIAEHHLRRAVPTYTLSSLNGKLSIERRDDRTFVLRTDRPGWLSNMFARIVRREPRLTAGRVSRSRLFDATLVELTPDGRDALAVRFDFKRPLGDHDVLFLSWQGDRFTRLDMAALPVGRIVPLADTSDVWKSMK